MEECLFQLGRGMELICADANVGAIQPLVQLVRKGRGRKAVCVNQERPTMAVKSALSGLRQPTVMGWYQVFINFSRCLY